MPWETPVQPSLGPPVVLGGLSLEFTWLCLSVFLQEYVDINPWRGGAQAFPQTSSRGLLVLQTDFGNANTTSCLPLSSNSPGVQLRTILTIHSPMWFYRNNLFLLSLLIGWVCPPPPPPSLFFSCIIFRPAIISACRLLLTEAGSTQHWLLTVLRAAFALDIPAQVIWAPQWGVLSPRGFFQFLSFPTYWKGLCLHLCRHQGPVSSRLLGYVGWFLLLLQTGAKLDIFKAGVR